MPASTHQHTLLGGQLDQGQGQGQGQGWCGAQSFPISTYPVLLLPALLLLPLCLFRGDSVVRPTEGTKIPRLPPAAAAARQLPRQPRSATVRRSSASCSSGRLSASAASCRHHRFSRCQRRQRLTSPPPSNATPVARRSSPPSPSVQLQSHRRAPPQHHNTTTCSGSLFALLSRRLRLSPRRKQRRPATSSLPALPASRPSTPVMSGLALTFDRPGSQPHLFDVLPFLPAFPLEYSPHTAPAA